MKSITNLPLSVFLSICIANLNVHAQTNKSTSNEKPAVEINSTSIGAQPGDKPITLDGSLLEKLLGELKQPRRMTYKDLEMSNEQEGFLEGGYTFVLRGDFNGDGFADIAFVGKYDNRDNAEKNCFIAVVTVKGKKVTREFFSKIYRDRVFLLRAIDYKPKLDAIGMSYNLNSDDCGYLYWNGETWRYDECKSVF